MASLRDVAREAGVSLGVASAAFTCRQPVSAAARQNVWEAAIRLGYVWRPKQGRQGFGVSIISRGPSLAWLDESPFYGPILDGLIETLGAYDDVSQVRYEPFDERGQVSVAAAPGPARGHSPAPHTWVVMGLPGTQSVRRLCQRLSQHSHVIVIDEECSCDRTDAVFTDDAAAMRAVVSYLSEMGHRRLAVVRGPQTYSSFRARYLGAVEGMRRSKLGRDAAWVVDAPSTVEGGVAAARELLDNRPRGYTAVLAANDEQALGMVDVFRGAGVRVPEDVSVVGFDDVPAGRSARPALTTVRVPGLLLGRIAACLVRQRRGRPPDEASGAAAVSVAPVFVRRSTTAVVRPPRTPPSRPLRAHRRSLSPVR